MHGFLKSSTARTVGLSLVILLGIFGSSVRKASAQQSQCCSPQVMCPSCNAQHEASEDRARAEKALKRAQEKAAAEQAEAERAIQEGNERAAKYLAKAQAHLQEGMVCNSCGQLVGPTSKAQHEAAEDRARAEKALKQAQDKAAAEQAQANQIIQEGNEKAARYEAKANAHLQCNVCGTHIE